MEGDEQHTKGKVPLTAIYALLLAMPRNRKHCLQIMSQNVSENAYCGFRQCTLTTKLRARLLEKLLGPLQ